MHKFIVEEHCKKIKLMNLYGVNIYNVYFLLKNFIQNNVVKVYGRELLYQLQRIRYGMYSLKLEYVSITRELILVFEY